MHASHLPIVSTIVLAYGDLWRVVRAMPLLIGCALLIMLALWIGQDLVPRHIWEAPFVGTASGLLVNVLQSFLLTPILIAIHRFIILGERAPMYAVNPMQPAFLTFFGWLLALSVLGSLVFLGIEILPEVGLSVVAAVIVTLVLLVLLLILVLRLSVLFPAVAAGFPGASARQALATTKGHVVSIFLIFLLSLIPPLALALGITVLLGPSVQNPGTPAAIVDRIVGVMLQVAITCLCVAIASRVFQALVRRI